MIAPSFPAEVAEPAPLHRSRTLSSREHTALLLDVARRYYLEEQGQAEIAAEVNFSRATVSRLLSEARRRGIVQIRVSHPLERVVGIERALVKAFGLKQVRVADPSDPSASPAEIAQCAADLLIECSSENVLLSVSNGAAVTATVDAMPQLVWPRSRVVQMIGSVGDSNLILDSPETCRRMARRLGGSFHPLPAPLVVASPMVAQALRSDNQIATTLELGARADIALVGVGAMTDGHSGHILQAYENAELAQDIVRMGGVAHICGHHISATGEHLATELCARTIAVDLERLHQIPLVIGVAWGEPKVVALLAALRGGHLSGLVTDRATAIRLLEPVASH
ncbi:MAG: sugar-binding domain-containing protein [Propionicimonas sp.]